MVNTTKLRAEEYMLLKKQHVIFRLTPVFGYFFIVTCSYNPCVFTIIYFIMFTRFAVFHFSIPQLIYNTVHTHHAPGLGSPALALAQHYA